MLNVVFGTIAYVNGKLCLCVRRPKFIFLVATFDMSVIIPPTPTPERGFAYTCISGMGEFHAYGAGTSVVLVGGESGPVIVNYHSAKVTAVAISPSSAWVASGDARGLVKIWALKGERILKYEYQLLTSTVRGISWSLDSKRLAVCGGDSSGEAVVVAFDTGSRLGEISGHSKRINSISFRPRMPFRVVTGSEDFSICMHSGPPFKFVKSQNNHFSFVNSVAFSPDGSHFYSAGSDGRVIVYDGETGEVIAESENQKCSLYGVTSSLWVVGGDRKLRQFEIIENNKLIISNSESLPEIPLGVSETSSAVLTVGVSGTIRHHSRENGRIISVFYGFNSNINSIFKFQNNIFIKSDSKTLQLSDSQLSPSPQSPVPPPRLNEKIENHNFSYPEIVITARAAGDHLAAASSGHEIHVYGADGSLVPGVANCWTYHKARITCMEWMADGTRLVINTVLWRGSTDCVILFRIGLLFRSH
jgi:WD40 repeat protein